MNEQVLVMNGVIDSYGWFRYQVEEFLRRNKDNAVRIQLDSYGGDVAEALAISRLLDTHGNVVVEFMGVVASAATWMAFGAKSVEMHQDTLWLCHKCSVSVTKWASLKADQLEAFIKQLQSQQKSAEVIDLTIAQKYLERCQKSGKKKNLQDVLNLMEEERYITAADCEEWGFVDKVIPGFNQSDRTNLANCLANFHLPPIPEPAVPAQATASADSIAPAFSDSTVNSFFNRLSTFLQDLFHKTPEHTDVQVPNMENPTDKSKEKVQTQTPIIDEMNKQFPLLNALLGVTALTAAADNCASLNEEQLQRIENALKENQSAAEALNGLSDTVKSIDGLTNKVNAVKFLVDRIPTGMPTNTQPSAGQSEDKPDAEDFNDPVNEYAKKNFKRKK